MDQEKREHIFDTAAAIFSRYGFKKASIDEIAREARVAKGTVYLAAPSKSDLFYEVLLREVRDWNAQVSRAIDPSLPADQQLVECARMGLTSLGDRPLARAVLLGEANEVVPELRARLDELRSGGVTFIAELLRLGVRQGVFRGELPVDELASILLDMHLSTLLFHVTGDFSADEPRLALRGLAAFDLILHGLKPRES